MDDKSGLDAGILDVFIKMTGLTQYKHIFTMEHIDLFVLRMDFDFVLQCLQSKFPEEFNLIAVRAKMAKLKSLVEESSKDEPTLEITIDTSSSMNGPGTGQAPAPAAAVSTNNSIDHNDYSMMSSSSSNDNNPNYTSPSQSSSSPQGRNDPGSWKPGQLRAFCPATYRLPEFKPPVYDFMNSNDPTYLKKNYSACVRSISATLFDQLRWQYYSHGIPAKVLHSVCTILVREFPKIGQYVFVKSSRKNPDRSTYVSINLD